MGGLYQQVCSLDTLRRAWKTVRAKGARGGIDGESVDSFASASEKHLDDLEKTLLEGRYSPEPSSRIEIPKFNAAREFRQISLSSIKDKIVQQAVRLVLEPIFEKEFLDCSYAYRPNKGARKAIGRVVHYAVQEKRPWVVFGDMDNFFDTLCHDRLLAEVKRHADDPQILGLLHMWLKIGAMDTTGRYHDMDLGITQGGIISPLLSNIYAHALDRFTVEQSMPYVRYADNFIAHFRTENEAHTGLNRLTRFIQDDLKLRLNAEDRPVRNLQRGFVFLGIFFRGNTLTLSFEKHKKIRRKLEWHTYMKRPHRLERIIQELNETITGVKTYYGFINPQEAYEDFDRYLAFRFKNLLRFRVEKKEFPSRKLLEEAISPLLFFKAEGEESDRLRREMVKEAFAPPRQAASPSSPSSVPSQGARPLPPSQSQREKGQDGLPVQPSPASAPSLGGHTPPATMEAGEDRRNDSPPFSANAGPMVPGALSSPALPLPVAEGHSVATPQSGSVTVPPAAPSSDADTLATPTATSSAGSAAAPGGADSSQSEVEKVFRSASRKVAAKKQQYVRKMTMDTELAIGTPGSFAGCRGNRLWVRRERKQVFSRAMSHIKSISINSNGVSLSSDLVEACAQRDIPIVFSEPTGRSYAIVQVLTQSKPDLGVLQLQALQNGQAFQLARELVLGKVRNQLNLLKFYNRHREQEKDGSYALKFKEVEGRMELILKKVREMAAEAPHETLRGQLFAQEGQAGACYWEMVKLLLPEDIVFPGRITRGAKDLVNSAINFGYSILYPKITRALLLAGLNLHISMLHSCQAGKPSLAYDLIEPFRPPVVDRAVLSLFTRGRELTLNTDGRLTQESVKLILEAIMGRLGTLVPYQKEKVTLETVILKQARLLTHALRENKRFKAFVSRY